MLFEKYRVLVTLSETQFPYVLNEGWLLTSQFCLGNKYEFLLTHIFIVFWCDNTNWGVRRVYLVGIGRVWEGRGLREERRDRGTEREGRENREEGARGCFFKRRADRDRT